MTNDVKLPPLPEPKFYVRVAGKELISYTAEQMQAYAHAAIEQTKDAERGASEPKLCKCGMQSTIPHICAAYPKGNPAQAEQRQEATDEQVQAWLDENAPEWQAVGIVKDDDNGYPWKRITYRHDSGLAELPVESVLYPKKFVADIVKKLLTPPQSLPWVGLDEQAVEAASHNYTESDGFKHGAFWAEEILRSKNAGGVK